MPHFEGNEIVDDQEEEFWDWYFAELKEFRKSYGINFSTLCEAQEYLEWLNGGGEYDVEEDPLLDLPLRFGPSRNGPRRVKSTALDKKPKAFVRRENSRCTTQALKVNRQIKIEN